MQPSIPFFRTLEGGQNVSRLVECTLFDRLINPDYVLPYNSARANVKVSVIKPLTLSNNHDSIEYPQLTPPLNSPSIPRSTLQRPRVPPACDRHALSQEYPYLLYLLHELRLPFPRYLGQFPNHHGHCGRYVRKSVMDEDGTYIRQTLFLTCTMTITTSRV